MSENLRGDFFDSHCIVCNVQCNKQSISWKGSPLRVTNIIKPDTVIRSRTGLSVNGALDLVPTVLQGDCKWTV